MARRGKRGRYSAVSGCAWRNRKLQSVSHAARGLLLDVWSFVADQRSGGSVTKSEMAAIKRGNPNTSRYLKELVRVGLVETADDGFFVHDYHDWNLVADEPADNGADAAADQCADKGANNSADKCADEDVDKPPSTKTDTYDTPFKSQVPSPIRPPNPLAGEEGGADSFAAWMRTEFVRGWERSRGTSPSMGGKNLGDFPARVRRTAELRGGASASDLYRTQLDRFLALTDLEPVALRAPFAAFALRWDSLLAAKPARPISATHGMRTFTAAEAANG